MQEHGLTLVVPGYAHHKKPYTSTSGDIRRNPLIRLQLKGQGKTCINDVWYSLSPGSLLICRKGDSYRLILDEHENESGIYAVDSIDYYLTIDGAWFEQWLSRWNSAAVTSIEVTDELLSLWRRLLYEKRNISENNAEMMVYLGKLLCLTIERLVKRSQVEAQGSNLYIPYRMKRYIEKNITQPLTLELLAERYGISMSTASHIFKKTFGQSPMRYALDVRLMLASEKILYTDLKLEQVAEDVGFRSYPYFCRAFKAHYHVSPKDYRQQNRVM